MEWSGSVLGWHRWLALGVGPAVLLWCFSGLVMLWVPYPSVTDAEWFVMAGAIDPALCCADLEGVMREFDRPEGIAHLRVIAVGGVSIVSAHYLDGSLRARQLTAEPVHGPLLTDEMQRVAESLGLGGSIISIDTIDHDVWTVHQRFDPHRPLWKAEMAGASAPVIYLSGTTGEVVQETTASERRWNLVGAVAHWWYLPWLRRQWALWDQTLWWVGALSTLMALTGVWLSASRLLRDGWKGLSGGSRGLHRLFGMIGGVAAACWIASGWLSMDHGRWFSDGKVSALERERAMGGRMTTRDVAGSFGVLSQMAAGGIVKELRLTKIAGTLYAVARESPRHQSILALARPEEPAWEEFSDTAVLASVRAMIGESFPLTVRPNSGQDRRRGSVLAREDLPPVTRVERQGPSPLSVDVDARTGEILEILDPSRRAYHGLFILLHRWDVPWFDGHNDIRRIGMAVWCGLGVGLAVSGFWILARRRLVSKVMQ
ncbi:MAG: hypothetical protein ABL970_06925 [Nitrospira sp.]